MSQVGIIMSVIVMLVILLMTHNPHYQKSTSKLDPVQNLMDYYVQKSSERSKIQQQSLKYFNEFIDPTNFSGAYAKHNIYNAHNKGKPNHCSNEYKSMIYQNGYNYYTRYRPSGGWTTKQINEAWKMAELKKMELLYNATGLPSTDSRAQHYLNRIQSKVNTDYEPCNRHQGTRWHPCENALFDYFLHNPSSTRWPQTINGPKYKQKQIYQYCSDFLPANPNTDGLKNLDGQWLVPNKKGDTSYIGFAPAKHTRTIYN
jgi:hypothetical protein